MKGKTEERNGSLRAQTERGKSSMHALILSDKEHVRIDAIISALPQLRFLSEFQLHYDSENCRCFVHT